MSVSSTKRQTIDEIFKSHGYTDYQWIDPKKIIVSQWVRLKGRFGFPINVRNAYDQKMDRYAIPMVH